MTRPVIIGAAVVVIIAGGSAAYIMTKDDDKPSQTNTSQTSDQASFAPESTEGLEFKATITTTTSGASTQSTIEHDDKNNTRYVTSTGGQQMEIIYTSDAYYSCQGTNCVKFPLSQSGNSGFDPSAYTYDQSKISTYRNSSTYKGKQSCAAGTCEVWSVSAGGSTSTIYIDTDTKRISQVESSQGGATSKIVYEYTDVTINVPANAQTTPTL